MRILLTGGAGFIGSHTAVEMTKSGHEVVIYDNFCNSDASVLERLEEILGKPVPLRKATSVTTAVCMKCSKNTTLKRLCTSPV